MNRFFTLLLAASCLTAVGQVPDYVPTDGLEAWYPLDGNADDASGNLNQGLLTMVVGAENRFGQESSALFFDSGSNGYVEIPSLNVSQYYPVTYSMWVKALELPISEGFNFGALIGRNKRYVQSCGAFGVVNINSDLSLQIWRGGVFGGDPPLYPISADLLSEWRHLALTMNENQAWEIYVDGYIVASGIAEGEMSYSGSFRIGSVENDDGDGDLSWDGWIDDVGIWDRALSAEEVLSLSQSDPPVFGCTDAEACNYDADADIDDGNCYPCEIPASHCGSGTIWDEITETCIVANPADINLDGCVQLNDLLDLLSAYGNCGAEESAWQCGDPLEYQGYDYETVQIGEQCWFAENLRAENYRNGDVISTKSNNQNWGGTEEGAKAIQSGDSLTYFDYCGFHYNGHSILDSRKVCPAGWNIPTDSCWMDLEVFLGMDTAVVSDFGLRGQAEGARLKSLTGWNDNMSGVDQYGFNALPVGWRQYFGGWYTPGQWTAYWSSTALDNGFIVRGLSATNVGIWREVYVSNVGKSIRCIKDTE